MKINMIGLTVFGAILVAANIVEAQFSYDEDQYGKGVSIPGPTIAAWTLGAGSWCLYANGGKYATTSLSFTLRRNESWTNCCRH